MAVEIVVTPVEVPFIANLSLSNVFKPVTVCTPAKVMSPLPGGVAKEGADVAPFDFKYVPSAPNANDVNTPALLT